MYITEVHGGKISVHRSGPGAQAQTLRSEQTGGPISNVFAGGLAILLDTLFRSSDADADSDALRRRGRLGENSERNSTGGIYRVREAADG